MSSHSGTHIDAPLHCVDSGRGINQMAFSATIGLAKVIEIQDKKSVKAEELKKHRMYPHERILLKTKNSFHNASSSLTKEELIYLERSVAIWLAERRISTVGIDSPSIGGYKNNGKETHRILLRAGLYIIEGLDLSLVKPGEYMLICLPLKIQNGNEAPARAILQPVR